MKSMMALIAALAALSFEITSVICDEYKGPVYVPRSEMNRYNEQTPVLSTEDVALNHIFIKKVPRWSYKHYNGYGQDRLQRSSFPPNFPQPLSPFIPNLPHSGYPSPGYPAPGLGYPAPGYPGHGYPAPGYPSPGYPAPGLGYPASGYPSPGYPAPGLGYPAPGYPGHGYPAPGYRDPRTCAYFPNAINAGINNIRSLSDAPEPPVGNSANIGFDNLEAGNLPGSQSNSNSNYY